MNENQIDIQLLIALGLEVTDRYKMLLDVIPKDQEKLLRHLAAATIHFGMFVQEVINDFNNQEIVYDDKVKKFFEECGCGFKDTI